MAVYGNANFSENNEIANNTLRVQRYKFANHSKKIP